MSNFALLAHSGRKIGTIVQKDRCHVSTTFSPRLVTSRQWTELPEVFLSKVSHVFRNQFKFEITKGEFLVDGRIYPEELIVRIGYLENGRLKQINFEASMDIHPASKSANHLDLGADTKSDEDTEIEAESKIMDLLYACIDALGSLLEEYFQLGDEEDLDVPNQWRAYEIEGQTIYLQHSTINTKLEAEADRLLGIEEKQLFHEESVSEDALKNAEIDAELAFEIQKMIRSGNYPHPAGLNTETQPNDEETLN